MATRSSTCAKAQAARLLSTSIGIGTRLPVQCAAAGWAILSTLEPSTFDAWLANHPFKRYTAQTVTGTRSVPHRDPARGRPGLRVARESV